MANKKREIKIRCDFTAWVAKLFVCFSSQLSDGYWEDSRGEWGSYEDGYHEDIWNCFEFDYDDGDFVIVLKDKPTWPDAKKRLQEVSCNDGQRDYRLPKECSF